MEIIDPGHKYRLLSLDGDIEQILTFVKRSEPPEKYPGNTNSYPGTTSQDVIRALLDRARYVNQQIPFAENEIVIELLQTCLWLLESRAKRTHSEFLASSPHTIEQEKLCATCGHVECQKHISHPHSPK